MNIKIEISIDEKDSILNSEESGKLLAEFLNESFEQISSKVF